MRSILLSIVALTLGGCHVDLNSVSCSLMAGILDCTQDGGVAGQSVGGAGATGMDAGQAGRDGQSGQGGAGQGGRDAGLPAGQGGRGGQAGAVLAGQGGMSGAGMGGMSGAGGPPPHHMVGMNLGKPVYYGQSAPFADVFKQRDPGQTTDGQTWQTNHESTFPLDALGYPKSAPVAGDMLRYSAFTAMYTGDYRASWTGTGVVSFGGMSNTPTPHGTLLHLTKGQQVFVRIDQSSMADPIKNIQIIQPGIPTGYEFHPDFLFQLNGMSVLRFMDWNDTNNSTVVHASQRPVPGGPNISFEQMASVCNSINVDCWINIPAQAADDYVTAAATAMSVVHGKVYVELSNEVWNGQFTQLAYFRAQGLAAGLNTVGAYSGAASDNGAAYWAGIKMYVRRAAQVHKMFVDILGPTKVVKVIGGQSSYLDVNSKELDFGENTTINPLGVKPDALAIAPYMGQSMDNGYSAVTVGPILSALQATIGCNTTDDPSTVCDTRANKQLAVQHHVRLITYEAGQHLVAFGSNASQMTPLFIAANRDPGMKPVYTAYMNAYFGENDDLLMFFNGCGEPYNSSGSWAHIETQVSTRAQSPKWDAILTYLGL